MPFNEYQHANDTLNYLMGLLIFAVSFISFFSRIFKLLGRYHRFGLQCFYHRDILPSWRNEKFLQYHLLIPSLQQHFCPSRVHHRFFTSHNLVEQNFPNSNSTQFSGAGRHYHFSQNQQCYRSEIRSTLLINGSVFCQLSTDSSLSTFTNTTANFVLSDLLWQVNQEFLYSIKISQIILIFIQIIRIVSNYEYIRDYITGRSL